MLAEAALWVEMSALGRAARGLVWLYPLANVAHVLGVGLLLGAIAVFDIAVLRKGVVAAAGLAGATLPLALGGAGLALASGIILFAADAVALAGNPMFWIKAGLIAAAAANAALWHWRPPGQRAQAALSLGLWVLALSAGRLIAYV